MPIINSILSWLNIKRFHQIDLFRKYPYDVQKDQLFGLINKAKDTSWGKKYDFDSIKSIKTFQERLPLQYYEDVKPQIDLLRKGEKNVLWPEDIKWFAKSSGTTSEKSKFIPVSKESLETCHFRGGKDILALYTYNNPDTKIFKGKGLTLGGSHKIDNFNNQSYYGDLSAILIQNLPFWAEFIKTPKQEIALMDKWEEKLEKMSEATLKENVTNIAGVPSWTLVLFKYLLEKTGKNNLLEIWPNLELFTHGGVSFVPYREQYKKLIPSENMKYMETYNASEGFFGIQDDPSRDDMLLMLDYGIFYEFIPLEDLGNKDAVPLTVENVELNKNYAIVITTNSGLWRYIIGDTITFTSLFPHKIKISGRTKHYINAFGEEIIIDNAEKALKIACEKTGAEIRDYSAGPVFMGEKQSGTHEWLIEFEKEPKNLEEFTYFLDEGLKQVNSDYEAKRYKNITLILPIVRCMKEGVFYQWLKNKGKLGGQNKVPRLSNDRKIIEQLLEINQQFT